MTHEIPPGPLRTTGREPVISARTLITRLTLRLELYINIIVVPLAVYYGAIVGGYRGNKLTYIIIMSVISATLATLFGMFVRIWKLSDIIGDLNSRWEDLASIKLRLLNYPRSESTIITLRWVFGLLCCYLLMRSFVELTWAETLPVFFILILCIPINSVISYSTTEHLLAPVLMDERIRGVYIPRHMYKLFSVSYRTTFIVISVLLIPVITFGHFLFISNLETMPIRDLLSYVLIILTLSLAAIFVTVYESNAGIQSGLMMTLKNLGELEKGNLDVEPIPLLTKGEIGIIGQSVNILAHSLRNSEEMFSKAFRSSPVGIVIWKIDGGYFLNINESFTKISGYVREEVVGRNIREVSLFSSFDDYERMINMLVGQGQVRGFDAELCTKKGDIRMVTVSAEPIMLWDDPCMIATIEDVTEKKLLEREIMTIGEKERQKIGQDLHDDLGPHLIGIEVMSELLKKKLEEEIVPSAGEVEKIRSLIEEAILKTRRLSRGLCPVFLADLGLESLLQEMASNIHDVYGITCTFHYERSIRVEDITVCTHIYYIVHEAIYNALRHGHADRVDIDLLYDAGIVTVTVCDNGSGMSGREPSQGMGLKIMNFRANMIGADLLIQSSAEEGTLVKLSFRHEGREEEAKD
ncbi:PAS domain S-box protein [bacterium]|nr:PAS domain S-box protein [bacterium]